MTQVASSPWALAISVIGLFLTFVAALATGVWAILRSNETGIKDVKQEFANQVVFVRDQVGTVRDTVADKTEKLQTAMTDLKVEFTRVQERGFAVTKQIDTNIIPTLDDHGKRIAHLETKIQCPQAVNGQTQ